MRVQGDMEREQGLPISSMFDREHPVMEKCQASFIQFIVGPLIDAWVDVLATGGDGERTAVLKRNMSLNHEYWKNKQAEFEAAQAAQAAAAAAAQPPAAPADTEAGPELGLGPVDEEEGGADQVRAAEKANL
jgi:hypothetical protein